ncbi:MAG: hypothetical protein ABH842_02145 [Candidatus Micrarchaeota archaeon]
MYLKKTVKWIIVCKRDKKMGKKSIKYDCPALIDLTATTVRGGDCGSPGSSADPNCNPGNYAVNSCATGQIAISTCATGEGAVASCDSMGLGPQM